MVLNRRGSLGLITLLLGAGLSGVAFSALDSDGLHPLGLLASLLPLQLAALLWVFRGAGSRHPGLKPPASG